MHSHRNVLSPEAHAAEQPKSRWGFTLPELLTCTAIVAVIIALALPAVQQAREAARRTEHKNHLKQIGIALHNHADAHGTFPAAVDIDPNTGQLVPWTVKLLPYLDQAPLYNMYNVGLDPNSQAPEVIKALIPAYHHENPGTPNNNTQLSHNMSVIAIAGSGIYKDASGAEHQALSDPSAINAQGGFFVNDMQRQGLNGMMPPFKPQRLNPPSGLSNVVVVAQNRGPNDDIHRPYFNPFNYQVNGADQNGQYRYKNWIEHAHVQVFSPPTGTNPNATPVDRRMDAYYLQNWTVTSYGGGRYGDEQNIQTVGNAIRPHHDYYYKDGLYMLMGDGRVIDYPTTAATGNDASLQVFQRLGDRNKGATLDK